MTDTQNYLKGVEELTLSPLEINKELSTAEQLDLLTNEARNFSLEVLNLDRCLINCETEDIKRITDSLEDECKALKYAYNKEINIEKYRATSLKFDIDKVLCKLFGPSFFEEEVKDEPKEEPKL